MTAPASLYGLLAEFPTSDALIEAVRRVRGAGYKRFDAFTPFPDEEVIEALGAGRTKVPLIILVCGILGGIAGYALQVWVSVEAYPLNVGGRPLHSWPAFVPPTFECTVLAASIGGLIGMLMLNGLPRPHHPLFEIPRFAERASLDGFFLCVEADDPRFERGETRGFLTSLGATEVWDVGE